MSRDDLIRLRHMAEAARMAVAFARGRVPNELQTDPMLRMAVLHAVQIVGEAAARVSAPGRAELAAVPWPAVVGMRNRLVHAYFDINVPVVWDTLQRALPELLALLAQVPGIDASTDSTS